MHKRAFAFAACAVIVSITATRAAAQNFDSAQTIRVEEVLVRVRRLTSSDVAAARAVVDSLVVTMPPGAAAMPEALFAKASIAPSAIEAERDYTRIVNDHKFSPRVPDALMRLALLESARNNRYGALKHLERLLKDYSDAPVRARASLMAGRLRLEANDPARACDLLAAAYASAGATERDVKDQAEQLGAKCPTPVSVMAAQEPPPLGVMRAPRVATPSAASIPAPAKRTTRRDSVLVAQRMATARRDSVLRSAPASVVVHRDTVPTPKPVAPVVRRDTAPTPKPVVAVVRRDSAPTPKPKPVTPVAPRVETANAPRETAGRFGVQFAAYNDKPGADAYAGILRGRGIAARVEGVVAPFRVRAGRFTTRAEADAAMAMWKKPGTSAFVVPLGPTP